MERLTEKYNGKNIVKSGHITFIYGTAGNRFEGEAIDKLAAYEQAEEQGLLLRLPISEDTPVYSIEYCCRKNKSNQSGMCFRGFCKNCSDKSYYIHESVAKNCSICEINKSVFFTHEEAIAKLAEMEGAE